MKAGPEPTPNTNPQANGLLSHSRQLNEMLGPEVRPRLLLLLMLMLIATTLEMGGLGLFIPFLRAVSDPATIQSTPILNELYTALDLGGTAQFLLLMSFVILVFFIVKNTVIGSVTYLTHKFVNTMRAEFSRDLLKGYLRCPYSMIQTRNSAELIRNLTEGTGTVFGNVLLPSLNLALEVILSIGVFAVLVAVDPIVSLIVTGLLVLVSIIVYFKLRIRVGTWGSRNQHFVQRILMTANQAFGGAKESKILGTTDHFAEEFGQACFGQATNRTLISTFAQAPRLLLEVLTVVGLLVLVTAVVLRDQAVSDVITTLGIFGLAAFRLAPALSRIASSAQTIREGIAALENVHRDFVLIREVGSTPQPEAVQSLSFTKEIRIESLVFHYDDDQPAVLDGIDLSIKHGESIALVGPSGAGKSTLADIILGIRTPSAGRICVDGIDIAENLPGWQSMIGYVPQDIFLLDDSVRTNVAFGISADQIDDDRVVQSLALAHLDLFIAELPDQLNTVLGERGARLSGGQRQRIGIARALYRDPDILVFDEATSALDAETENQFVTTIAELARRKTLIVIAHRLSTIRHCDTVILLEDGHIVDAGTPAKLLSQHSGFIRKAEIDGDKIQPNPQFSGVAAV
ncbi:MAG: ABC transporter ATP-binding protein [Proteobacteria bacterium]|nr:ABC transporter ATP-binding protein [Pseudomonadota bacterium]